MEFIQNLWNYVQYVGKNPAVIFLNAKDKDGKAISKGYCLECAQKAGNKSFKKFESNRYE